MTEDEPYWRQFWTPGKPIPTYLEFVKPGDIVESWDEPPIRGHVIAVARNTGTGCRPIVLVTIAGSRGAVATWEKWNHVDD